MITVPATNLMMKMKKFLTSPKDLWTLHIQRKTEYVINYPGLPFLHTSRFYFLSYPVLTAQTLFDPIDWDSQERSSKRKFTMKENPTSELESDLSLESSSDIFDVQAELSYSSSSFSDHDEPSAVRNVPRTPSNPVTTLLLYLPL